MIYEGEFVSVWDDGIEVKNKCTIDTDTMKIIDMEEDRWCDDMDIDIVDDAVDVLLEEYVYIPELDTQYSACAEYALEQWKNDFTDYYGNGIVTYSDYLR